MESYHNHKFDYKKKARETIITYYSYHRAQRNGRSDGQRNCREKSPLISIQMKCVDNLCTWTFTFDRMERSRWWRIRGQNVKGWVARESGPVCFESRGCAVQFSHSCMPHTSIWTRISPCLSGPREGDAGWYSDTQEPFLYLIFSELTIASTATDGGSLPNSSFLLD